MAINSPVSKLPHPHFCLTHWSREGGTLASRTEGMTVASGQELGIYKDRPSQSPHSPQPSLWSSSLVKLRKLRLLKEARGKPEASPSSLMQEELPLEAFHRSCHGARPYSCPMYLKSTGSVRLTEKSRIVLAQCRNFQNTSQGSINVCD